MSKENSPNFHMVKFVTAIITSYLESLRGDVSRKDCPDVTEEVAAFANKIEKKVDKHATERFLRKGW